MMMDTKPVLSEATANISHQEVGRIELTRFEKMHVEVFSSSNTASLAVAKEIADLIKKKEASNVFLDWLQGLLRLGCMKNW